MAGQRSRLASTPVRAALITQGVVIGAPAKSPDFVGISYRDVSVLAPGAVDVFALGLDEALHNHPPGLGGVDDVVDHGPASRDVGADGLPDLVHQLLAGRLRVV